MHFNTIKAGFFSINRSLFIVGYRAGNVVFCHGARHFKWLFAIGRVYTAVVVYGNCRCRQRQFTVVEVAVRRAAGVPHLQHDFAVSFMNALVDGFPALHHLVGVDPGSTNPAIGL